MLTFGDYEQINLSTGEKKRRVAGNGLSLLLTDYEISILKEYEIEMKVNIVPEIIQAIKNRQRLAQEAKQRIL